MHTFLLKIKIIMKDLSVTLSARFIPYFQEFSVIIYLFIIYSKENCYFCSQNQTNLMMKCLVVYYIDLNMNGIKLPKWLDDYIFNYLGATYCRCNTDMVVLDWDKSKVLQYLGTYFPRSFVESYTIFSKYIQKYMHNYDKLTEINIFDFGCGTGGEIIGLIFAINELLPNIKDINIQALDGNSYSLRILEKILSKYSDICITSINLNVFPEKIEDFYDMNITDSIITQRFDFIIIFKAICEFVTKQQFETKNPYEYFINVFLPKLSDSGIICISDITSYNNVSQEWLPTMMDKAINESHAIFLEGNSGYNESFIVSHSRKKNDISKIAWRLLTKKYK